MRLSLVRVGRFELLPVGGGNALAQPREIRADAAIGHVRPEHQVRMLLHERHELVIEVFVADAVRKRVEPGAPGILLAALSARTWNDTSVVSWPRLCAALTP